MNSKDDHVLSDKPDLLGLGESILGALVSRTKSIFLSAPSNAEQLGRVQEFYEKERFKEERRSIVDGSSTTYRGFIESTLRKASLAAISGSTIVDLGCGQALVSDFARSLDFGKYVGVDALVSDVTRHSLGSANHVTLIESSLLEVSSFASHLKGASVLMSNSLCYVHQDAAAKTLFRELHDAGVAQLVIVDPHPSLYWENQFSGIRIELRTVDRIASFCDGRFSFDHHSRLFQFQFRNKPIWRVSNGLIFQRDSMDHWGAE